VLAKEALSVDTETVLPVFLPGRQFDVRMTRSEFEEMVRAPIESTIGAVFRALSSARVSPSELRAVLLVGGSSRIPLVARMVSDAIGRPTVVDSHPKYAVALGAATVAGLATRRQRPRPSGLGADPGVSQRVRTSNNSGVLALASVSATGTPGESVEAGFAQGRIDRTTNGSPTGPARTTTMTLEVPAAVQTHPFEPPSRGRVSPNGPGANGGADPARSRPTADRARRDRSPETARRLLAAGMLLLAVLIAVFVGYLIQSPTAPTSGTTSAGQLAPAARPMAIGPMPTGVDAYPTDINGPTPSVPRIGGPR
jgi:hypothetical protein